MLMLLHVVLMKHLNTMIEYRYSKESFYLQIVIDPSYFNTHIRIESDGRKYSTNVKNVDVLSIDED